MIYIFACDKCKKEFNDKELNEIILYGTDDLYNLKVCNKCYEILNDYFTPEQIDEMFR